MPAPLSLLRPLRRNRLALLLSLALVALPAGAQGTSSVAGLGAASVTDLDTVRVNAYRPVTSASGATKTNTPIAETSQSVSVIAREELDARGVQSLNDAMRYVAGVSLESSGIDNRVDDFRLRGFDAGSWSNNVTLDGMRAPQGSQWNRSMFDSWNLERVEVLKGPSAVMYGQVAPGGMVNQVSKTPRPDLEQQLRISLDAHGQHGLALDLGGAASDGGDALWRVVGLYRNGHTQIRHAAQEHWLIAPSFTWQITDRTRLTLLGMYQQDRGGSTYQFLPMDGTLRATPYGYMKNTTFIGEPGFNTYNRDLWTAGYLFEHAFNENWTLSQSLRHTRVQSLFQTVVTSGALNADGRTQNRRATWGEGDSTGDTIDTRLVGKFGTGAADHTMLLGLDWQQADWTGARGAMLNPKPIDIFNPVYSHYTPVTIRITHFGGVNEQTGLYLQDQIALGQWRFTLGGRYDWTRDDTYNFIHTVATGVNGPRVRTLVENEAFSANAGVLHVFDNGITPYLSYAESFQPAGASVDQSYTRTPFDPITGQQWETGLKYQPASFDGLLTLSAYDLRQQNILIDDPEPGHNTCGTTGVAQCQVQSGEGRVRGAELEGRVTPLQGFSVIGAATWMDSRVTRGMPAYQGKELAMVPAYTASLWGDYTFHNGGLAGLSLAAGLRYNGQSYGDSANLYRIPSYTLLDAAIRYNLGQVGATQVKLTLNASNLADKRFVSTCSGVSSCFYGTGRSINASLQVGW